MRLDQLIKALRSRRRIGKLYTAGIRLPKGAHSFLKVCSSV
jgi:hypothetical protein